MTEIQQRLDAALALSEEAERIVLKYFRNTGLQVELKGDQSPVTVADRGAESFLREEILKQFPDDAILGEEFGEQSGTSGYRWILDPIDGTKAFIYGIPLFGMLLGLQCNGENVAGVCRMPGTNDVVYAQTGGGAWWQIKGQDPVQVHVSKQTSLSDSLFVFTDVECWQTTDNQDVLLRMADTCRLARGWGDCFGHMLVATGRAEVMIDPLLSEWDAAALIPIISEAGGVFMDWTGETTATGGNGISTTPALKEAVLATLRK